MSGRSGASDTSGASGSPVTQAVGWEVRLREAGAGSADWRAFEQWRTASPDNGQAWDHLQQRLARIGGARSPDAQAMARALRVPSTERRRALRTGFGLAVLALGTWGTRAAWHGLDLDADWCAAVAERGAATLADGTPMAYDAGSRIRLAGSVAHPLLELARGQLLLKAWPQAGAGGTVSVATAHGLVTTGGAVLTVGRMRERSVLSLDAGSALLRQPGRAALPVEAGATLYFDAHGAQPAALPFDAVTGWTRGVFVADRLPLAELLEVFGRYRHGMLRAGERAAGLRISGVFPLDDIARALAQVADALPVRLTSYGRYVTLVE